MEIYTFLSLKYPAIFSDQKNVDELTENVVKQIIRAVIN